MIDMFSKIVTGVAVGFFSVTAFSGSVAGGANGSGNAQMHSDATQNQPETHMDHMQGGMDMSKGDMNMGSMQGHMNMGDMHGSMHMGKEETGQGNTQGGMNMKQDDANLHRGLSMGMGLQSQAHDMDGPHAGRTVAAHGVVDAVDVKHRTVSISHDAIKSLGWPAMTMVFRVAKGNKALSRLKVGAAINFWFMDKGPGDYVITKLRPSDK